jgi:hypothetical protein
MKSWDKEFKNTWLASDRACKALDAKLGTFMAKHWGKGNVTATSVLPLSCSRSAAALRDLGRTPDYSIICSLLLAMLGEMLLCAEDGGILREDELRQRFGAPSEQWVPVEALRRLRNAVCHPAEVAGGGGASANDAGILAFADFVAAHFKQDTWAAGLRTQPSQLAQRNVTLFGLRLVESIGRSQAHHWGVRLPKHGSA